MVISSRAPTTAQTFKRNYENYYLNEFIKILLLLRTVKCIKILTQVAAQLVAVYVLIQTTEIRAVKLSCLMCSFKRDVLLVGAVRV